MGRDFHAHHRAKPRRCHSTTVAGRTIASVSAHRDQAPSAPAGAPARGLLQRGSTAHGAPGPCARRARCRAAERRQNRRTLPSRRPPPPILEGGLITSSEFFATTSAMCGSSRPRLIKQAVSHPRARGRAPPRKDGPIAILPPLRRMSACRRSAPRSRESCRLPRRAGGSGETRGPRRTGRAARQGPP
jgi:hypothetical protein